MKKIFSLVIGILVSTGMMAGEPSTPASQLIARLKKIQKKGMMIGHQDDPVYGHNWKWDKGRSDVKEVCGDYPAVMGFELGGIELGHKENIDHVPFDRMRQEIISQYKRGGVITLSWHPSNPVTGKNAWDPSGNAVKEILPGGFQYQKFEIWLKIIAGFFNLLKTPEGKTIPVIFRPWHEMGGNWFWWGSQGTTPEEYKKLYILTYHRLTDLYKCNNLVWAFSPNSGIDHYMKYYPGNHYVDLLGIDLYDFDHNNAVYEKNLRHDLGMLQCLGRQQGKLIALTETGAQTLPDSTWFTQVFWPVAKKYPICYSLFWRNAWDNPKELYIAAPGLSVEKDFKVFAEDKKTLFDKDIENIK